MTKEQLWDIYVKKNPQFEGEGNVTLSKAGLRKLFNTTWDIAEEHILDLDNDYVPSSHSAPMPDFFKQIFG